MAVAPSTVVSASYILPATCLIGSRGPMTLTHVGVNILSTGSGGELGGYGRASPRVSPRRIALHFRFEPQLHSEQLGTPPPGTSLGDRPGSCAFRPMVTCPLR
jgi:hypothetical protein